MKIRLLILCLTVIGVFQQLHGQNIDLLSILNCGKYRGTAGSGLAVSEGISSIDFNPAGLVGTSCFTLSFAQQTRYRSYDLQNECLDHWGEYFQENDYSYHVTHLMSAVPLNKYISIGGGFAQKLNPYIKNHKRYITYSIYFDHATDGNVYAFFLSAAVRLRKTLCLGITVYEHNGTITSRIQGDDHGTLIHSWAQLESRLKGLSLRTGCQFRYHDFHAGLVFEPPYSLNLKAYKSSSEDKFFATYLPNYQRTTWKMPLVLGAGVAYSGLKDWILMFDFETRQYRKSNVQLQLFEYGRVPDWNHIEIFRTGVEYHPLENRIPFRFGYARIPQLYSSHHAMGEVLRGFIQVDEYKKPHRNIRHLLTAGTTLVFSKFKFNITIEYTTLQWRRYFQNHYLINDKYTEKSLALLVDIIYSFGNSSE